MNREMLVKNVRPLGGENVDVLVVDGRIQKISKRLSASSSDTAVVQGENAILIPGFVDAHSHLDKTLWGLPWHRNQAGPRLIDKIENERRFRREMNLSAEKQATNQIRQAIRMGTTHIRTHVDVDTEIGLKNLEGILVAREKFKDFMTFQIVAFPQSGLLIRPGTIELLEEAIKAGAELVGGIDPSTIDRDPVRHINTIFDMAGRHGVGVDIHIHEPSTLGAFSIELVAERTKALGLQGKVNISHAFCLGMIDDAYLSQITDLLLENKISIMTHAPMPRPFFPPIKRLREAGVVLCSGSDGIRDTWAPYGNADMLERAMFLSWRSGFHRDEDLEMALDITTFGGAKVVGAKEYGLEVGCHADFVLLQGETRADAIVTRAPRKWVVKNGQVIAKDGQCLI
jgi:cytosine/adenosine deaminase-related metal-dependent hydrolase